MNQDRYPGMYAAMGEMEMRRHECPPMDEMGIRCPERVPMREMGTRRYDNIPMREMGARRYDNIPMREMGTRRYDNMPMGAMGARRYDNMPMECIDQETELYDVELARAYVPFQIMCETFSPLSGLKKGTIFPPLYDVYGWDRKGMREIRYE